MSVPFLDLKVQYQSIKPQVDQAIQEVIDQCSFALGPAVEAFEKDFATFCGAKHCIGVGSGTAALELAIRAHDIGPGDEVITVANSFFATAEAISLTGADPVLVDCSEDALIDITQIEQAMSSKTKAIIPVHLYGQPADMDPVMEIAAKHSLVVIEDSAQGHGARYKKKVTGSLGHSACFSFYPGKNLGAYGEGGAVTTNNDTVAANIRMLRSHGEPAKYRHAVVGRNDRLDGIQGAVLSVKLKHLPEWNQWRRAAAHQYDELLAGIDGVTPIPVHTDRKSVYHLYVVRVQNRDEVQKSMSEKGIATGIHYPIPIHLQPAYEGKWSKGQFPIAETLAEEILSLPMFPELTSEQIEEVCAALRESL